MPDRYSAGAPAGVLTFFKNIPYRLCGPRADFSAPASPGECTEAMDVDMNLVRVAALLGRPQG